MKYLLLMVLLTGCTATSYTSKTTEPDGTIRERIFETKRVMSNTKVGGVKATTADGVNFELNDYTSEEMMSKAMLNMSEILKAAK